ncbi:MAG TPA: hypothetical protein VNG31_08310, partial [Candidatus Baltobacteraceae bacterium]|nr:hypothetical protein [Candidatus Baltobacteraceae bacterium]
MLRPRVTACVAAASLRRITLLVAPAGYGKSVAVDQYLAALGTPWIRFDVVDSHRSAEAFRADFRAAMGECAAEGLAGTIAIDGWERAGDDPQTAAFLIDEIAAGSPETKWIVATRSVAALPVATWLAYGQADVAIGPEQLRFTRDDWQDALGTRADSFPPASFDDVYEATHGWPAAAAIALRLVSRSGNRREVVSATRDALFGFLDEQIYRALDSGERELLEQAAALPAIDADLLESCGLQRPLETLEAIVSRTALLQRQSECRFTCDAAFREFLHHRVASAARIDRHLVYRRAADALEDKGETAAALTAYARGGAAAHVLRLLEAKGFDLIERAQIDAVQTAIDALPEGVRREHPRILALRGMVQAARGKSARSESLLARSLARANDDGELRAAANLHLALLATNEGRDVTSYLRPIADDPMQSAARRAEALALLAAQRALAGDAESAREAAARVEPLLPQLDHDASHAKVLQRIGVAAVNTGDIERARRAFEQAADLATELELYSLASRAFSGLSNLMRHHYDDVEQQLALAERAVEMARKAQNVFDLKTGLIQVMGAKMR